ncbi:MAG TPA: hypothetical protein VNZ22_14300, partial [Bacillota bacterium]|nr:hypothetical protein [Bacillota bacterium]
MPRLFSSQLVFATAAGKFVPDLVFDDGAGESPPKPAMVPSQVKITTLTRHGCPTSLRKRAVIIAGSLWSVLDAIEMLGRPDEEG